MNHRILILLAACAIALSAQSVNFTISNPGHVLTATKSDPRAVEMFTVDLVDSKGNPKGEYIGIVENRIWSRLVSAAFPFLVQGSGLTRQGFEGVLRRRRQPH